MKKYIYIYPKDLWAHSQNECNVNYNLYVFFPERWLYGGITYIVFEPVVGKTMILSSRDIFTELEVTLTPFTDTNAGQPQVQNKK